MKSVLFDTSVLVAASVAAHPHHARARVWVEAARKGRLKMVIASHGLAETWATLTAMPLEPRLTGEQARRIVDGLRGLATIATAGGDVTMAASARCAELGLRSGAVYDALHVAVAPKADVLLTFNVRDFERLVQPDGPRVVVPPDPPRVSLG